MVGGSPRSPACVVASVGVVTCTGSRDPHHVWVLKLRRNVSRTPGVCSRISRLQESRKVHFTDALHPWVASRLAYRLATPGYDQFSQFRPSRDLASKVIIWIRVFLDARYKPPREFFMEPYRAPITRVPDVSTACSKRHVHKGIRACQCYPLFPSDTGPLHRYPSTQGCPVMIPLHKTHTFQRSMYQVRVPLLRRDPV